MFTPPTYSRVSLPRVFIKLVVGNLFSGLLHQMLSALNILSILSYHMYSIVQLHQSINYPSPLVLKDSPSNLQRPLWIDQLSHDVLNPVLRTFTVEYLGPTSAPG